MLISRYGLSLAGSRVNNITQISDLFCFESLIFCWNYTCIYIYIYNYTAILWWVKLDRRHNLYRVFFLEMGHVNVFYDITINHPTRHGDRPSLTGGKRWEIIWDPYQNRTYLNRQIWMKTYPHSIRFRLDHIEAVTKWPPYDRRHFIVISLYGSWLKVVSKTWN